MNTGNKTIFIPTSGGWGTGGGSGGGWSGGGGFSGGGGRSAAAREAGDDFRDQDRQRISDAIRMAEERTSGEIVCVLMRSASTPFPCAAAVATLVALSRRGCWSPSRI